VAQTYGMCRGVEKCVGSYLWGKYAGGRPRRCSWEDNIKQVCEEVG